MSMVFDFIYEYSWRDHCDLMNIDEANIFFDLCTKKLTFAKVVCLEMVLMASSCHKLVPRSIHPLCDYNELFYWQLLMVYTKDCNWGWGVKHEYKWTLLLAIIGLKNINWGHLYDYKWTLLSWHLDFVLESFNGKIHVLL